MTAVDALEPIEQSATEYRTFSQIYMEKLLVIDDFCSSSVDPRVAWASVALFFRLPSVRGCDAADLARQIGCRTATLQASIALRNRLA